MSAVLVVEVREERGTGWRGGPRAHPGAHRGSMAWWTCGSTGAR